MGYGTRSTMEYDQKEKHLDLLAVPEQEEPVVVVAEETYMPDKPVEFEVIDESGKTNVSAIVESEVFTHWMDNPRAFEHQRQEMYGDEVPKGWDFQPDALHDAGALDDRPTVPDDEYFFPAARPQVIEDEDPPEGGPPSDDDDDKPKKKASDDSAGAT